MKSISREALNERLANDGLALIEVLSPDQYREFHLPGAMNVPLDEHFEQRIQKAVPDKDRTVVVYCYNSECQASSKAARRMDELGYQQVCDYEAGKVDCRNAGVPTEK